MEGIAAFSTAPATLTEPALPADAVVAASISSDGLALLGRRQCAAAASMPATTRPGAPARRDPERPAVGAALPARPWHSRPRDRARRTARGGRRRDGARASRFPEPPNLWVPMVPQSAANAQPDSGRTLSVFGRLRTASPRVCPGGAPHAGWPLERHGAARGRTAAPHSASPINEQMVGRVTDLVWRHIPDRRRAGAAHRLRERRQPAADARRRALARVRDPDGARRKPRAAGAPAARRGPVLAAAGGVIGVGLSLLGLRALALAVPSDVAVSGGLASGRARDDVCCWARRSAA